MQAVTTIGLDIAKSVFQVHGVDAHGNVVVRRQLKRRHVLAFFEKLPPCLIAQLASLRAGAKTAPKRLDKTAVERERGQRNLALPSFVSQCANIWRSLTDRRASASRVENKKRTGNDPDFVLFLQDLAHIAGAPKPSRHQVESSLKSPATSSENSS